MCPDSDSDRETETETDPGAAPPPETETGTGADADSDPDPDRNRPEWWIRNEEIKREMGLPEYEPSKFEDGQYTHEVVDDLEERHGCRIQFVAHDVRYPEDWLVRIDDEPGFSVGRHRDANGNTVFETTENEFRRDVNAVMDGRE